MMTARRSGRSSFLSQIPAVPKSVTGPDAITEFFTLVQRTYERAQEAMETAKSGYNIDVAKKTLSGGGGAFENRDKAWEALKKAKADGLLSVNDVGILGQDVMGPLVGAISQAQTAIIENEGRGIAFYWNSFSDYVAKTIANSTGFVTEKWHNVAKTYRLIDDYLKSSNAFLAKMEGDARSPDAMAYLNAFKASLGALTAQKASMETTLKSVGIPLSAIQEAASKEDVSNLGAEPATGLLATVIIGSITVATVLKVLAAIYGTFVLFMFGVFDTILPVIGLEGLVYARIRVQEENVQVVKDRMEAEKAAKALTAYQAKQGEAEDQVKRGEKTLTGLGAVAGLKDQLDELNRKVAAERAKNNVSAPMFDQPWVPWALAIGGGAIAALVIYKYVHRKNA